MIVLTAIRKLLQDNAAVAAYATGGIHMNQVPQNATRPNVMLLLVSGTEGWTHDGADGLHRDLVRIYSRGDSFQEAALLGDKVRDALNAYVSVTSTYGNDFKLIQHTSRNGDYQDEAKVHRQIDDYRVHYRAD